jgi:hypothetical protein
MPGPEAAATLDLVRALLADGADVTVVSPIPSAAHHHADPGGAKGALRLLGLVRDIDRLILRLDAHPLGASSDPPQALPGRLALAAVLRRAGNVELVLDRVPATVSKRWVQLIVAPARLVTVATEGERDALRAAGADAERIAVAPREPQVRSARQGAIDGGALPASPSAREIRGLIQERAAALTTGADAATRRASVPLRHLPPLERAPVKSHKPAGALIKKVQARVLGWQFDWVIEHLNKLHQATIEAVEGVDDAHDKRGRDRSSS